MGLVEFAKIAENRVPSLICTKALRTEESIIIQTF